MGGAGGTHVHYCFLALLVTYQVQMKRMTYLLQTIR